MIFTASTISGSISMLCYTRQSKKAFFLTCPGDNYTDEDHFQTIVDRSLFCPCLYFDPGYPLTRRIFRAQRIDTYNKFVHEKRIGD